MSLVQAKCPECGGLIEADNERRLSVCQHCSEPFVVEEAIQSFNETATADALDTSDNNIVNANEDEAAKELPLEKNGDSDTSCKELSKDFPAAYKTSDSSCKEISYDNICKEINDDFVIDDGVLKKYTGSAFQVVIPASVTEIDEGAFYNCTNIESITIPKSVDYISPRSLYHCTNLLTVNVDDANVNYSSVDGVLFNKNKTELVLYPPSKKNTDYTIPVGVVSIGRMAFFKCNSIETITFSKSVEKIHDSIVHCSKLIAINVNDDNAYFTSVDGVLFNRDKTKLLLYPQGKTDTDYTLPDSVKIIGGWAFSCCAKLTTITIPDSVEIINGGVFSGCTRLTSITLPDGIPNIGSFTFQDCTSLTSITLPDSVISIGFCAFKKCKGLTSITLPDSVKIVDCTAFSDCEKLVSIIAPDGVDFTCNIYFERWEIERLIISKSEIERQKTQQAAIKAENQRRRNNGLCQHCGGEFRGVFVKRCSECGTRKDY